MTEKVNGRKGGPGRKDGAVLLPQAARLHLRVALEQMDLLLETQQAEAALPHLLSLLRHMRALRRDIR